MTAQQIQERTAPPVPPLRPDPEIMETPRATTRSSRATATAPGSTWPSTETHRTARNDHRGQSTSPATTSPAKVRARQGHRRH